MVPKPPAAGSQFENKVRHCLRKIGFKEVPRDGNLVIGSYQVDAVGGWDDVLFVVEATQTRMSEKSIRARIPEVRGKVGSLIKGFRSSDSYLGYKRFEFALVTQGYRFSDSDLELAADNPRVHLIDYQVLEYYKSLAAIIGPQPSLFNFLGELGIEPQDRAVHRMPAFRVEIEKNLTSYLFFCEPHKLLEVAYVARRETGRSHYYQRMLTSDRIKSIRSFISGGGIFPNNIILAFDEKPQFKSYSIPGDQSPTWLEMGELAFPKSYRAAWIIDGQHRLYAFGGGQPAPYLQKLPVFAFDPMTESRQAKYFIDINQKQKPVSPDLIWDLEADLRPESDRGRIALCVRRLNELAPLKDRIYVPLSGGTSRGKIKISSICTDINEMRLLDDRTKNMTQTQRNPLTKGTSFEKRSHIVASNVAMFLNAILDVPDASAYQDDVILKPGGVTLVLRVYEQMLIREMQRLDTEKLGEYAQAFVVALDYVVGGSDKGVVSRFVKNQLTSYSQRREVVTIIIRHMSALLNDAEFGKQGIEAEDPMSDRLTKLERHLAEFVADSCGIYNVSDLKQNTPKEVWTAVERRYKSQPDEQLHKLLTLGEVKQLILWKDTPAEVLSKLTDAEDGFSDKAEVAVALGGLTELRNSVQHGRTIKNRRLNEAYLATFERVLAE